MIPSIGTLCRQSYFLFLPSPAYRMHFAIERRPETMYKRVLFSWFLGCLTCLLQSDLNHALDSCQHLTCHECITDPALCVWCSDDSLKPDERCQPASLPSKCSGSLENPEGKVNTVQGHNLDFSSDEHKVIQIRPQKIAIALRVGVPQQFEFSFKPAKDYPVDLYFLIDASYSMRGVRDAILKKSKDILKVMRKLTNNIHMGLGSFIDKNRVPYEGKTSLNSCYSFKHNFDLSGNLRDFEESLAQLKFGYNYDSPESGLDGLAQVMTCKERLRWRSDSRKVIIFVTDAPFHYSGDGKWSGLTKPYDAAECYLNEHGYYTKEREMDYPSVSIINKLAAEEQFTILFFVNGDSIKNYSPLSRKISSAYAVRFQNDTISDKLDYIYKNISTNLLLDVKMPSEYHKYFQINFDPDCTVGANCKVSIGEEINVKGTIKLKEYYGLDHTDISIVPQALKENLVLDVEIISRCGCQNKTVPNSFECSSAGSKQCGICICNSGRNGPTCACVDSGAPTSLGGNQTTCVKDGVECSQNGICTCGACSCFPGFGGYYCQYRTDNCKRDSFTKALCSGHGSCEDGRCRCRDGWRGEACDCSPSTLACKGADGFECNNRGHCECGRCKCNEFPDWDVRKYGEYCERQSCEDCHRKQCLKLINCVSCRDGDCPGECHNNMTLVNGTMDLKSNWNVCANMRVAFGCYNTFSYAYDEKNHTIVVLLMSEPNCIESCYVYGGVSLAVLLIAGLVALAAWKLTSEAQDRAEFERFIARAREEDQEILNACYNPPSTTYKNPMFNKLSFRKGSFR